VDELGDVRDEGSCVDGIKNVAELDEQSVRLVPGTAGHNLLCEDDVGLFPHCNNICGADFSRALQQGKAPLPAPDQLYQILHGQSSGFLLLLLLLRWWWWWWWWWWCACVQRCRRGARGGYAVLNVMLRETAASESGEIWPSCRW